MKPRRAGWIGGAAALVISVAAIATWAGVAEVQVLGLTSPWSVLLLALPLAAPIGIAAGVLTFYVASAAQGRDGAERLLALTTAGLTEPRAEWGTAMRAELASIDVADERRGFARSAGAVAVFSWRAGEWIAASGVAVSMIALALVFSRLVLGVEPDGGLLLGTIIRAVVLFGAALAVARVKRSFRSGLEVGLLALALTVVGVAVVRLVGAVVWAQDHALAVGPTVLDALSPVTVWVHFVGLVPWIVLGAAVGVRSVRAQKSRPKAA